MPHAHHLTPMQKTFNNARTLSIVITDLQNHRSFTEFGEFPRRELFAAEDKFLPLPYPRFNKINGAPYLPLPHVARIEIPRARLFFQGSYHRNSLLSKQEKKKKKKKSDYDKWS